ncbi:MAG: S-adenosyl-l-methionine hydroxide adenosyltransferase family protein [Nitrososphaerota archaeon]|nr:S-adenosyl-l-methionine hydroxide adenosyltransferase family protein [Candidatus Bathyarchaeota archaeon]MDW8049222.1 S-adenosyl-l-methionine hydroxide adenosyltransferase family protein [Nitrososphaerota archaeon]
MVRPIITLLSDFGLKDPYVAEMKAVILSICREAVLVDISHNIDKYDIRMGAFVLAQAAPYFPDWTIHLAIVDPGVGTERRPIIIETRRSYYVGPDNGLLMLAAKHEGIRCIREIRNPKFMLAYVSRTFHGRDIFAPAAAHLANGVQVSDFGPEVNDPVTPSFVKSHVGRGVVSGEVIYIDSFGNVVTNISSRDLEEAGIKEGSTLTLKINDRMTRLRFCSAYGDAALNAPLMLIGGTGLLEIAVNQGNASKYFGAYVGDKVSVAVS